MEKFIAPNDNFAQEENINSEPEMEHDDIGNDEEKNEQSKNKYDQPASQKEISELREEVEKKIEKKAEEIRISETEDIEIYKDKIIELAGLDLESLNPKNLEDLNCGSLEFIKDSIDKAISEFWRSEKTGELVTGTTSKLEGSVNEAFEFAKKHKKIVSLGELALYASSFGPAVLKDLAGDDVKVEIYDKKISLKDLVNNPELINEIEQSKSANSPVEIGREFSAEPLICDGFAIKLNIMGSDDNDKMNFDFHGLSYGDAKKNQEMYKKLEADLHNFGFDEFEMINLDIFEENKEEIAKIISSNSDTPKETVLNYIDSVLKINTSKISVVEFENWKINKDFEFKNDEVIEKYKEISNKYNINIPEEKDEAINEFEEWGRNNGYDNIWAALEDEQLTSRSSLKDTIKGAITITPGDFREKVSQEQLIEEKEGFENHLTRMIEEEYTIDQLKEIAENDPKEIINILSQVIGKNVEYDWEKYKLIEEKNYDEIKRQAPYHTLETGKGVCEDYSKLFAKAKDFLENEGVPNLNKFLVLSTTSQDDDIDHAWNVLITVDKDGELIMTSMDITWADDDKEENISKIPEKLNAVDDKHYYTGIIKKVNETHNKALEKIKDYNILAFQEKLKEVLTQYDSKHKPEIEVDKKVFEKMTKKKKRSSREDKENAVNSLP